MGIQFREDHSGEPFQLFLAISSPDKANMKLALLAIIDEFDNSYGKPLQGIVCGSNFTKEVITPKWNGRDY